VHFTPWFTTNGNIIMSSPRGCQMVCQAHLTPALRGLDVLFVCEGELCAGYQQGICPTLPETHEEPPL
jgi:hypothetical protein